jgi:hypothetical protein
MLSIWNNFRREACPEISLTEDLETPAIFARYLQRHALALPSTGGAVMLIFMASP